MTLTIPEARRFYDRFGAKQDDQDFYERAAIECLLAHGNFAHARSVFELGCGTGRLARELLTDHLPPASTYRGVDISSTMVNLARDRLAGFPGRVTVTMVPGDDDLPSPSQSVDRFVATYVLDLLPAADIRRVLGEAHRILEPGGLLCIAGITDGTTVLSRVVMKLWSGVFKFFPAAVGGCRPTDAGAYLDAGRWQIEHREAVVAYGIASEVVIASRR
jgi:ubiquinone/menaquinone biosynthesis C-methylase UbiE